VPARKLRGARLPSKGPDTVALEKRVIDRSVRGRIEAPRSRRTVHIRYR